MSDFERSLEKPMNRKRIMSNQWIDPNTCRSLAVLVESVTAPLLIEHSAPICLEIDIDTSLDVPADPVRTVELLRTLVGQALAEMPDGGDLSIAACETSRGVELELADTGCDIQDRATRLPLAAAAIGAQVIWQNCPQGGGAVTVTFRRESGQQRVAA
jgi:signal transduction histidine kinase